MPGGIGILIPLVIPTTAITETESLRSDYVCIR
jgi:hypothetical protein